MALTIPATRTALPEQNASREIDPSRQFGNQTAAPVNMPSVPRGVGGIQIDQSAEVSAYGNLVQGIGGAVLNVIDDRAKKEEALHRANETVEFEKAKIDYVNAASEAMQKVKAMRQAGELTDDDAARQFYESELLKLRDIHLPEGKYKDLNLATQSKVYAYASQSKFKDAFRDNVIIPEQTAKYMQTINQTNAARSVQAMNDGRIQPIEQIVPTLKQGLQSIDAQYDSGPMAVLMTPEQISKGRAEAKLQYIQSFMTGMSTRDINLSDTKADKLEILQRQIANQQQIKQIIFGDASVAANFGSKVDEALRAIDNSIMQKQQIIQSEQDRRQRSAEAAADRAERNAVAAAKADVALHGTNSKYFTNLDSLPPTQRAAVMDGYEKFVNRQESTLGKAQQYEQKFSGKSQALTNPTKDDIAMVDSHLELVKPQLSTMQPEERAAFLENTYFTVGVVPTEIRDNIRRGLNSSDPLVVKSSLDAMLQIERSNPAAVASAFSPDQKAMLISHKAGVQSDKIINYRDKQAEISNRPEAEINKTAYASAKAKNEVDFKNKVDARIAKDATAWWQFGKPDISPKVRDEIAERTKVYINSNIPFNDAVRQAVSDVQLTSGVSELAGPKKTVVRFSPEVMTGRSNSDIKKEFAPVVSNIKNLIPNYRDVPTENFILLPSDRTTAMNPTFEVWFLDTYGNAIKVRDNNYQPIHFNAGRK